MARKRNKPSVTSQGANRPPADASEPRLRLGQSWRVVTARVLPPRQSDDADTRREVPEIRLSGAWLGRVGFAKGTHYLISIDKAFGEIILHAMDRGPTATRPRKRR